jgi:hypothetical protein
MSIQEHIAQFKTSNKTMRDYCLSCGLSLERFKYHLYKSRRAENSTQTYSSSFIPISFQSASQIEILYTNGVKIVLSADTPASFIKSLIA